MLAPPVVANHPVAAMSHERLRNQIHDGIDRRLAPVTRGLARAGVHPNQVTVLGATVAAVSAALVVGDRPAMAGALWVLAGCLDLVDGAMARATNRTSALGAFLDSTLDRVSEGVMLAAIAYRLASDGHAVMPALVVLALLGSVLVSYTRARAEAIGLRCTVGLFTRAERVVIIGIGLFGDWLEFAVALLVIGTAVTAAQRVRHVCQSLNGLRPTVGDAATERVE